ncbi:unnamed protein product, partial [Mesorhabditis spiculigera]
MSDSEDERQQENEAPEPSPSNRNYCYSLECAVRIESTSSGLRRGAVQSKSAIVTVGRNAERKIVLQIEIRANARGAPAVSSYELKDCVVHEKTVAQGKGGIEIPARHLSIHLSNCAPRKLNVFLKSLAAKIQLMAAERQGPTTPIAVHRQRLLTGGLPDIFTKLSPLTVGEIRKVRSMRGIESPLARKRPAPSDSATTPSRTPKRPSLAPSRSSPRFRRSEGATPSRPKIAAVNPAAALDRVVLSAEQKMVVRKVVEGRKSVFFTGSAGTGKSLVLRRIIEMLPAATTVVTAATGVAACQLGGTTLHSFAGFGVGGIPKEDCLRIVENKKQALQAWKQITHLVIDEISMVDADYFTCLEYVARKIRCPNDRPLVFGGIQLVITGDFLQLPPVVPRGQEPKFCFESPAWNVAVQTTILLKQVRRQDDAAFVRVLNEIRVGRCPAWVSHTMRETRKTVLPATVTATRLCTHSADAEAINRASLQNLNGPEKTFHAEDSEQFTESSTGLVSKRLILKQNAQVMLTKNLDLARGLSNGARGVVTGFAGNGFPLVRFLAGDGEPIEIRPVRFQLRSSNNADLPAIRRQLPLQLAWAISIHKSQGLTLDAVEVDLQKVFAEGQAYVALSRARSLPALKVTGFDGECVRASKKVVDYYESLENANDAEDEEIFPVRPIAAGPKRTRLSF